jgi:iron complex transport system substrate-binding protein
VTRASLALLWLLIAPPAPAGIAVVDDTGAEVRLAAPARRIVTLAPHATELVFAAGAGKALVATVEHSDEPPAALALPRIGGLAGIDREALLAAGPDLVVAWQSGNPPGLLAWIEHRGIAVYRSEPRRLADVERSVAALATLAGRPAPALPPAAPVAPLETALTASFLFWDAPPIAAGADHVLNDLLNECGATPAVAGLGGKAVVISHETLLAAHPELVFTTDGRVLAYRDAGGAKERFVALPIGDDERLALQAAQRPGPRLYLARTAVCRHLADWAGIPAPQGGPRLPVPGAHAAPDVQPVARPGRPESGYHALP